MLTEDGALYVGMNTDNKEFLGAIQEAERRVKGFSDATAFAGDKVTKTLNDITQQAVKMGNTLHKETVREIGLIADLEQALVELKEKRRNANSIEEITKYNQKIKEAEQDLKDYNQAGLEQIETTETLTKSIENWALGLGGATAILGVLKKAFQETTGGMNLFNQVGAISSQVLYDIVSGAGLSIAKLQSAVALQRELNDLRIKEYSDGYKAAQLNTRYQELYSQSLDQTLSGAERLKLIDEALEAHNSAIDLQIENVNEMLDITRRSLIDKPGSEKLKKEFAELMTELQNLEAERYTRTKRLTSQRSGIVQDEIEKERKWRKDLHDDLQRLADEQIEIDRKKAEELRKINNEVDALKLEGMDKELLQLKQQYEIDIQANADNQKMKVALTEKYGLERYAIEMKYLDKIKKENAKIAEEMQKAFPGMGFSILNRAIENTGGSKVTKEGWTASGLRESRITELTEDEIERRKTLEELEADRREKMIEYLGYMEAVTSELEQQGRLTQEQSQQYGAMVNIAGSLISGDKVGAAMGLIQNLVANISQTFPGVMARETERLQSKINEINKLLAEQRRLIGLAPDQGGGIEGYTQTQNLIQGKIDANNAAIEKYQKIIDNPFAFTRKKNDAAAAIAQLREDNKQLQYELEDSERALDDLLYGSDFQQDIANALIEGLEAGKIGADDFGEYMQSVLKKAMINSLLDKTLLPAIQNELVPMMEKAIEDGDVTTEEMEGMNQWMATTAEKNKVVVDAMKKIFPDTSATNNSFTGSIQALTEGTGSVVAGQVTAIRIGQSEINNSIRQQLLHLSNIEANTKYLKTIDSSLSSIDSKIQNDSLRANGL